MLFLLGTHLPYNQPLHTVGGRAYAPLAPNIPMSHYVAKVMKKLRDAQFRGRSSNLSCNTLDEPLNARYQQDLMVMTM
ncbi:MAG: hypothetical protein ACI8ZB_004038 [Desulforhopalus sp.]|jgi:hypothetical protein